MGNLQLTALKHRSVWGHWLWEAVCVLPIGPIREHDKPGKTLKEPQKITGYAG